MFQTRKIVSLIVLLITICVVAYVIVVVIPTTLAKRSYEGARQIGEDIRNIFHFTPEVTVNNTIVLQQESSILELATVSQTFQHRYSWVNTWIGSTKKITISGTFEAKAGFDLKEKFGIDIQNEKAIVHLPEPQLLSLESQSDLRFTDENGVWNWVDQDDRAKAVNAFNTDARKFAAKALFVNNAKARMEEQLREILMRHVKEVEFRYPESLLQDR